MAYVTSKSIKKKHILVLLGPSGSGKTTYGEEEIEIDKDKVIFLSTGLELRKHNVISAWQEVDMTTIKDFCHTLIEETFANFKMSETHDTLILDSVKDLEDAEYVAAEANKHGLQVTRALLFDDIGPEALNFNWKRRREDRDIFRGSAHAYLRSWYMKSNDLINFYKRANILCSKWVNTGLLSYHLITKFPQTIPSTNNLSFLLTSSAEIKKIVTELLSILKISELQFTLPASFVHCYRDVTWVTNPSRYHVTAKADGVRCLLVKIQHGTYLITRKKEIYPCYIPDDKLPQNTVLDGELLPSTSISEIHPKISTRLCISVFLVFDVLAISGDVLWKWPFTIRQESLCKLPISKDITAVIMQASANNQSLASPKLDENNEKELVINCALKEHKPSIPDEVITFLGATPQTSCPSDGLIFTPNTAYVFGPDPLLFKWQSKDSIHCDILLEDLRSGKRKCAADLDRNSRLWSNDQSNDKTTAHFENSLNGREVMECQWNPLHRAWDPLFVRRDKSTPNSEETIEHLETICKRPYTEEYLIADLTQINGDFQELKVLTTSVNHPSVSYSFDDLYAKLTELVNLGYIEKTIDSETKLEIFNYTTSFTTPLVSLCRGLVLHQDSKTIVTKPFVRFFEDVDECNPNETVEATIKYDGSLGIAFVWNGEVIVTTRRRMDSEQTMWAKQWINDHCNVTRFQPGYTYLFEIIYQNNTVIVNYLFEGLVLLAISDESGLELPYDEVLRSARTIGFFMVTPRIIAPYSEIMWYCAGINLTFQGSMIPNHDLFVSGALSVNNKRQEGWVVKFNDGRRQKIVYRWWKAEIAQVTHLVHPQIVWLLVKHDKVKEILGNVPNHIQVEINRMIRALGRKFMETVKHVEEHLLSLRMKSTNVSADTKGEMYGVWEKSLYLPASDQSDDLEDSSDEESFNLGMIFDQSDDLEDSSGEEGSLDEQNKKLCFIDNITSDLTSKRNEDENFENDSVTIIRNFVKLARQLNRYFKVTEHPYACDTDVNLSPVYNQMKENYLRLPVLDHICPTSPQLDGYDPSDNFKQTWCKGWKTLPINQLQFIQKVFQKNHASPPFLQLPVEVILLILDFVDGKSLAIVSEVCMMLRNIVMSSHAFKTRILMAKEEAITSIYENWSDGCSYNYPSCSYLYSSEDDWGGYGSG